MQLDTTANQAVIRHQMVEGGYSKFGATFASYKSALLGARQLLADGTFAIFTLA
jgi:hypothetical protein